MVDILHLSKFQNSIINSEYSSSLDKNQVCRKKDIQPVSGNIIKEFYALPLLEKLIMEEVVKFDNNFPSIYFSQGYLAKKFSVSRKTINEAILSLRERGYLHSQFNLFFTCDYTISSYFRRMSVRQLLSPLIKAFKYVSIAVITTSMLHAEKISDSKVTRVKSPFVYIKTPQQRLPITEGLRTKKVVKKSENRFSHRKRKKFLMKNPIMPEIRHIPNVDFTIRDQIALSLFPVEAILFAVNEIRHAKNIRNKFTWFRSVCRKYCEDRGIQPNYQWITELEQGYKTKPEQFSIKDESPYKQEDVSLGKQRSAKYTAPENPLKREEIANKRYAQAMADYKKSKPVDHWINRKTFQDEYTEGEILKQIAFFENPPNLDKMIAMMGEKAARDYVQQIKQNWMDRLPKNAAHPPVPPTPQKYMDEDSTYSPNYNDDELYEEINEEIVW